VLTDRVLTLLLAGTLPHRILCLTFTKAAAAEMSNRIAGRLAKWATMADERLAAELAALTGRVPDDDGLAAARRLFARVLDAPGGMHIETIHAFCQSLLRRFPLEAGLAPHFQVMDERDAGELLAEARDEVLAAARDGDLGLARALATVTAAIHETAFPELMAELASERGRLKRLVERHGGARGVVAALRRRLGLEPGDTAATVLAHACDDASFDAVGCRRVVEALLAGSKTDQERGAAMAAWLADPAGRLAGFGRWQACVLTTTGEVRKTLLTKGVREAAPWAEAVLAHEAERIVRIADRLKAARVAEASEALLVLATALLGAYQRRKGARAVLDYDDLILAARGLLAERGVASWVLFKLDGGIDHVLIDEAQDTNPDQWAVVAALTEEFFAGRGAREVVRTVFAVGDAKQSIYSFQRADPRAFEEMRARLKAHVPACGGRWDEVALQVSFRSTSAVLDAVDAVFAGGPGWEGVAAPGEDIRHLAHRRGHAGTVELWPPVIPRPLDEPQPWKPPIERIRGDQPSGRLARLVARRIRAMVDGETLASQGRPLRPGDVMVLVRRRGGFVEDLVRELKTLGVPVAGADRMVLTEQMAVMDLMALAGFLLLPEDDLTLATVLKGPLVGLTENQLFALAQGRGTAGLWETLKKRVLADPAFEIAYNSLADLLAAADHLGPHALFARVLGPLGGRRRLLARLGAEAEDPIDEFMALTLAFERAHPPSLQGFLRWLETGAVEIKRDLEQGGRDAVRIMTVHGSKGLQAPVVFLPDTLQMPTRGRRLLWLGEGDDEMVLWPPNADAADAVCREARDAARLAREREYRRLLYVAMTRAEDRLIVCGWQTRKGPPAGCWYNLVRAALEPAAASVDDAFLAAEAETDGATVLRLSTPQTVPPDRRGEAQAARGAAAALPDWAAVAPEPEPVPPPPRAPTPPDGDEPPVRSPLAGDDGARRFRRGQLIHRLLQTAPELARDKRSSAMMRFLGRAAWGLDTQERLDIANEVADLLDHPRFVALFGPGSRAEVPVVGHVGDRIVSGVVDRLVVTASEVLVVDYKTNRRPPAAAEDIPELYVRQMAAYRVALACIYPGRSVRCALVWTDGPKLIEIEPKRMDDALTLSIEGEGGVRG
jgi:ATP-dependent helicase/nuclease subunit A